VRRQGEAALKAERTVEEKRKSQEAFENRQQQERQLQQKQWEQRQYDEQRMFEGRHR
jgi:hypothetical protein